MTEDEARAIYEKKLAHMGEQHRYIAQAQKEVAARRAILPNLEAEVIWAKACLDSAEGRDVDWSAVRAEVKRLQAVTETQLDEVHPWRVQRDDDD